MAMAMVRMIFSSARIQRHAVHDVVVVPGGIVDQLRGLALTDLVGGARHDRLLASRPGRESERPGAESEAAEILPERCGDPGLAGVARHFDCADAIARIPGDAADINRPAKAHARALRGTGDQ